MILFFLILFFNAVTLFFKYLYYWGPNVFFSGSVALLLLLRKVKKRKLHSLMALSHNLAKVSE